MNETVGDPLAILRARYEHWLGLDREAVLADRDEAAEDIRALQLIVRMERDHPPGWHRALGLAASAVTLVCLDPRAAPGGPWHNAVAAYCTGHIRKVTRRARGTHWTAVQDLPGHTLGDDETQVRALLPGRAADLDKRVAKLQVGGTDAPYDEEPPPPDQHSLRMWLPPTPVMTLGKSMAQAGHAGMLGAALLAGDPAGRNDLDRWHAAGCPASGTRADAETWAALNERLAEPERAWHEHRLLAVRDAGFTEIEPGTITVVARAPGHP